MAYERDDNNDIWEGDELKPEVRRKLINKTNDIKFAVSYASLLQWIPVYLAFIGLFFSGANIYANTMTRIATIETRLDLLTTVITELKGEIRYEREHRDGQQEKRR